LEQTKYNEIKLYISEDITPEQELFISRTNSANNLSGVTSPISSTSPESNEKSNNFKKIWGKL